MGRIFVFFFRRLRLPILLFAGFGLLCVPVYMRLEGLRWQDALFWILNPHAIDYHSVHNSTKVFYPVRLYGSFCRSGMDCGAGSGHELQPPWNGGLKIQSERNQPRKSERPLHYLRNLRIWPGRSHRDGSVEQSGDALALIETNEGLYRALLKDGVMFIQEMRKGTTSCGSAGIDRARGICIVIDNDADNLYITVTARALNPNVKKSLPGQDSRVTLTRSATRER
jgi:voltage-gated potassium channel Kch